MYRFDARLQRLLQVLHPQLRRALGEALGVSARHAGPRRLGEDQGGLPRRQTGR